MQGVSRQRSEEYKVLCGTCPDEQCRAKLFFPAYDKSIECTGCGQRHEQSTLQDIAEVTNPSVALHNILKNILLGNVKPKKGPDNVKVLGLSNYVCKSISPILTRYGMDKKTGKAKLLSELSQPEMFDCGKILGDRAFLIEEENLNVVGYGRDKTGSVRYLKDILREIEIINDNEERLVPIHADGDGHCLVHAVSRALVGRELFWHALRLNLMEHFRSHLQQYKEHFKDFVDSDEWDIIIQECNPEFIPSDGEPLGLRNIHVFGLANVLHRPIILLDSYSGMQSSGDYSGVFLPALFEPEQCRSRDGSLNKPLCIAWSSLGRNHYIPLVGIKGCVFKNLEQTFIMLGNLIFAGRQQPKLPRSMIQRAWGVPAALIDKYIEFDDKENCHIGGDKCLSDKYIRTLVTAMEEVFVDKNGVPPQLVADVHQFLYKSSGIIGVRLEEIIQTTQTAVQDKELYRCLTCDALIRYQLPPEWFRRNGSLYNIVIQTHGQMRTDKKYAFPLQGVTCTYDKEQDVLVPDMAKCKLSKCSFCQGDHVRLVNQDGSIQYSNGDRTTTRSTLGRCACGFKHYWDGKEYDNLPEIFPISLEWNGKVVGEKVVWFQHEEDPSMNSNVFEVAQKLVQKHFPGEFGSERLVQRVVDTVLRQTASRVTGQGEGTSEDVSMTEDNVWSPESPSKIILTGYKHKTMHKEELTKSDKEKQVKKQIETNAPKQQHRKSKELAAMPKSSPKKSKSDIETKSKPQESDNTNVAMVTSETKTSQRKVRIATSDGRTVMLDLSNEVTFSDLQKMIESSVNVPPHRQKIRIGFPPKELKPPSEADKDKPIPLQHGEKIAVEVLADQTVRQGTSQYKSYGGVLPQVRSPKPSWSSFEEDANTGSAEGLLQSLKDAQEANDSLDAAIASLTIMASITGKDLWTHVQSMPHLFSVGGLFYKQVERDLGLVDGKHCQLPFLPGKVFRYSAKEDRLELCMEPYGHFAVEPNIEKKAVESTKARDEVHFGSSGAVKHDSKHVAFSGQGHSLRTMSDIEKMPTDITESSYHSHHSVRNIQSLCDPNHHGDSIPEEPVGELLASGGSEEETLYQRLGPGISVIDSGKINATNQNIAMFRELADSIQKTMHDLDEEMSRIDGEEDKVPESNMVSMETDGSSSDVATDMTVPPTENKSLSNSDIDSEQKKDSVSEVLEVVKPESGAATDNSKCDQTILPVAVETESINDDKSDKPSMLENISVVGVETTEVSVNNAESDRVMDLCEDSQNSQEAEQNVVVKSDLTSAVLEDKVENMETAEEKPSNVPDTVCEINDNADVGGKSEVQECSVAESVLNKSPAECDKKDHTIQTNTCEDKHLKDPEGSIEKNAKENVHDEKDEPMES